MPVATNVIVDPEVADGPVAEPNVRTAIAVLVSGFPRIDETFILREINELERLGQPVILVPLRRDYSKVVHEEAKPWRARALYTPLLSTAIIKTNLLRLVRQPLLYLRLLSRLVIGTIIRPAVMIRTLALFPKSVYLADLLPRMGIRHLHAHFAVHPTTTAYIIHRLSGATYSFTVHGPDVFAHQLLLREKIARAKFVRSASTFSKAFLTGLYPIATEGKIEVVRVGLNPDVYAQAASESTRRKIRTQILSVATLSAAKGFNFLIDACARLVQDGVDLDCTIVGEGPLRHAIMDRIRERSLESRMRLTGALPQHEVARLISDCDIFVLPSVISYNGQMDGMPIALMEAMAAGRPVVASAISAIPELVENEISGILVDATHSEWIARSIRRLIDDPPLREQMGRAGQKRVQDEFDVRRTSAELIRLFERHDPVATTAAQGIASLDWQHLRACALGIRRIRERPNSIIAEVTITDGISKRDVVVKQQRSRAARSLSVTDRTPAEFETLTRLRGSMDIPADGQGGVVYSVPRVLLFDRVRGALVMDRALGRPLDVFIREARNRGTPGQLVIPLRRAATWLRRMQQATLSNGDGRMRVTAMLAETFYNLDLAAATDRKLRKKRYKVIAWLRELESRVAEHPPPMVGHHGDYCPANVFLSSQRVDVIDFEGFREGLALEDVAYFLVHLTLQFASPIFSRGLLRLEHSFLDAYADGQELDGDALRLFKMAKAVQLLACREEEESPIQTWAYRRALRKIVLAA